jgi:CRISPR-associated protein Cmr6
MAYPFYETLQNLSKNMQGGNFGLWYNKFIPIANFESCKVSDERGNDKNPVLCYYEKYNRIQKDIIKNILDEKHADQAGFCNILSAKYESVAFKAKLKTPLITGIGESHPHEVSMVFDHNLGIPYIPASGIKGIVRFAHTLGLLDLIPPEKIKLDKEGKEYFDDDDEGEADWTNIPQLFGTQGKRGSVFFLDAYPEKIPELHIDIMNPHYGKYYSGESPPADYLDPNPLKFLTVAKDTVFIFRALVDKSSGLLDKVKAAFIKALTEEGIGAKTAVGYGIFDIEGQKITEKDSSTPNHPSPSIKKMVEPETWENVTLSYAPGTGIISTRWEGKNASTKDQSIIPAPLLEQLKAKRKAGPVKIKVELIGGKEYRLLEIEK